MRFRDPSLEDGPRQTITAVVGEPVTFGKIPNWFRLATIRRFKIPATNSMDGGF